MIDFKTARLFTVIAIAFNCISIAFLFIHAGFTILSISIAGDSPIFYICLAPIYIVIIGLNVYALIIGVKLKNNFSRGFATKEMKRQTLIVGILSFIGAGGTVNAVLYILLYAMWDELKKSKPKGEHQKNVKFQWY